ncbi:MAG: hypothetical protein E7404_09230 [Ruminococcaceae bacterium]|nr:hypothetical protein [Oscillospiraceae bacterium]
MKKNLPLLILPFAAIIVLISIFLFSGALCPDENGYLLKYQAQRFKIGSGNASFYDDSIKYEKGMEYNHQKTFTSENADNLKFYKSYSGGYVLGALTRGMSERNAWRLMAFLSVLLSSVMGFFILKQTTSKIKAAILLSLFLVYPSILEAYFKMNQCIISMCLVSLLIFVYYMKTDYFLKWYLLSIVVAFLYVDNHFYVICFYIIPVIAYFETKKETTSAKAVSRAMWLLIFGIFMNVFCAHFYSDGENIFKSISFTGFLDALKSPFTVMVIINLIGAFKCPEYTKKYIYPSFVFYIIFIVSALFSQSSRACETSVLPAIFIGFATCIIHQRFFRKYFRIMVILIIAATVFCGIISVKNAVDFSLAAKNIVAEEISIEDETDKIIPTEEIVYMDKSSIKEIYLLLPRNVAVVKNIPEDANFIISDKDKIDKYEIAGKYEIGGIIKNIFIKTK